MKDKDLGEQEKLRDCTPNPEPGLLFQRQGDLKTRTASFLVFSKHEEPSWDQAV